jgi:uncharacterized protein (DUF1697 family)
MTTFVALLRAVNVSGTNKLPMSELRAIGEASGFTNVRTYIASGNMMFEAAENEGDLKAALEAKLEAYAGRPVPVLIRSALEIAAVHAATPFPDAHGSRLMVYFLDEAPAPDALSRISGQAGERLGLGTREIYVDYGDGIRFTKLKIPAIKGGTGRNLNTVAKLAAMMSGKSG